MPISKEEFCRRFVEHMVTYAGFDKFDCGTLVRDYAEETAPTYYAAEQPDRFSPEECSSDDMSYWGE